MSDLERRRVATEKTRAKYRGRAIDWKAVDCVRMLRSHLVAMGHRKLPKVPRYQSPAGARRALKAQGFDTLEALLDTLLPKIPPAAMLPGDIALIDSEAGHLEAVTISLGIKMWGWHVDNDLAEPVNITVHAIKAAYRA